MAEIYYDSPLTGEQLDAAFLQMQNIQQTATQVQSNATAAAQSASQASQSANSASQSASQASTSAQSASESQSAAASSASSASESAKDAAASASSIEGDVEQAEQSAADAKTQAKAAASSAAAAQQAAQEALGFRTFFSAITPDENGDLDPSRPMTTPTAQASQTIKSKGDRIQGVQVNGFTQQAGSGTPSPTNVRVISTAGIKMQLLVFDGSSDENWLAAAPSWSNQEPYFITGQLQHANNPICYANYLDSAPNLINSSGYGIYLYNQNSTPGGTSSRIVISIPGVEPNNVPSLRTYLQKNPLYVWCVPLDENDATGLYIPIELHGDEYRCQCLKLTAPLCAGDNVQSNYNGQQTENHASTVQLINGAQSIVANPGDGGYSDRFRLALPQSCKDEGQSAICDTLSYGQYATAENSFWFDGTNLYFRLSGQTIDTIGNYLSQHPITIQYPLATPAAYTQNPVTLVAVPYTSEDTDHTPSTYVVSSQDGTTVQVSLKAMQDGGDAATLAGHTWSDIQKLISDAVASAVALSQ